MVKRMKRRRVKRKWEKGIKMSRKRIFETVREEGKRKKRESQQREREL